MQTDLTTTTTCIKSCRLVHHGAAATVSGNQIVTWIPASCGRTSSTTDTTGTNHHHVTHNNNDYDDNEATELSTSSSSSSSSILVYASNAILNITKTTILSTTDHNNNNNNNEMSCHDGDVESPSSPPPPLSPSCNTSLRHVQETLRCTTLEKSPPTVSITPIVITCVVTAKDTTSSSSSSSFTALVTGFSNGMIQVWLYHHQHSWTEHTISVPTTTSVSTSTSNQGGDTMRSITAIDAIWLSSSSKTSEKGNTMRTLQIAAGTSAGMTWYECTFHFPDDHPSTVRNPNDTTNDSIANTTTMSTITRLCTRSCGAVASLQYTFITVPQQQQQGPPELPPNDSTILLLFIGTAAPRQNKIHVYQCHGSHIGGHTNSDAVVMEQILYGGCLLGHEDWVTTLSGWKPMNTNVPPVGDFLLASGSQDARIRIWKFRTIWMDVHPNHDSTGSSTATDMDTTVVCKHENDPAHHLVIDENDNGTADDEFYDNVGESRLEIVHHTTTHHHLPNDSINHRVAMTSVTLEALLCGHEEGITSVVWHPNPKSLYGIDQMLISSSTDRTILLWSETPTDDTTGTNHSNYGGIWTPLTRVGSAGGILGGSIGSTLLGFCGIAVEPSQGRTIVGHAYGGALHIWDVPPVSGADQSTTTADRDGTMIQWKASPCITGHFAGVTDCSWETANGDYLLTVSNDQTCRLWAQMKSDAIVSPKHDKSVWLELARPQVHGYNLSAVASLSTRSHPHLIVTGADEKEIRAFDAPKTTLRLLDTFSHVASLQCYDSIHTERVERAYIPSLGLSNKASPADAAAEDDDNDVDAKSISTQMTVRLPLERDLGAVSLWPEVQKLFGHNTEIYCLATTTFTTNRDNAAADITILASSAKARDADDAKIRLWNARTGQCLQVLSNGHRSTVATMSFSTNGEYLASSGKDRRLCVWKRRPIADNTSATPSFELAWALDSAHRRIVWSVHFCPYESQMLASASRDGCIKVWCIQEAQTNPETTTIVSEIVSFSPSFQRGGKPDAVTAISFAPIPLSNQAVLAIGLESGRIELWFVPYEKTSAVLSAGTPNMWSGFDPTLCHCDTVTTLAWRPIRENTSNGAVTNVEMDKKDSVVLFLASCSLDHGCRIFEIEFSSKPE